MADAPPEVAAAPSTERFGKFVRVARLGSGGMGEVWKAWDTELGRWVALKFLRGSDPDVGAAAIDVLLQVQTRDPRPPARADRDLQTVVLKCLEKQPSRRYATAPALAEDLDRWLRGEPVRARPVGWMGRLVRRARRNPLAAVALAALVLVAVTGLGALVRLRRAAAANEERLTRLSRIWLNVAERKRDLRTGAVPADRARAALEEAVRRIDAYIDERPSAPEGWYLRSRARIYQEHFDEAEADARRAIACAPQAAQAHELLAMVHLERAQLLMIGMRGRRDPVPRQSVLIGRAAEAFAKADRCVAAAWAPAATSEDEVMRVLSSVLSRFVRDRDGAAARRALEAAIAERRAEEYAMWLAWLHGEPPGPERLRAYIRATEFARGYARAWLARGLTHRDLGDRAAAIECYTRALELEPRDPDIWVDRARARKETGDFDGAIADCDEALKIDPRHAMALANRGSARDAKGDRAGALADYDAALAIDPDSAVALHNRAAMRMTSGDLDGALSDFDRAIATGDLHSETYVGRAMARYLRRDYDGALADYAQALEINPRNANAYCNRGVTRQATGDKEGAIRDYTKAIELDGRHVQAMNNRGVLRQEQGDLDGAIRDYTAAIEVDPTYVDPRHARGTARLAAGDRDGAHEDFTEAIRLNPRHVKSYVARGTLRRSRQDVTGAIEDFSKALEVAPPEWRSRASVERALRELRGQ